MSSPNRPPVARRLIFDSSDEDESVPSTSSSVDSMLRSMVEAQSDKYNFDFINGRPLPSPGPYDWTAVPASELPEFYSRPLKRYLGPPVRQQRVTGVQEARQPRGPNLGRSASAPVLERHCTPDRKRKASSQGDAPPAKHH